jgi:hypothetical protein
VYAAWLVHAVAAGSRMYRLPVACVTHQQSKHLHRFELGVVIGPDVHKDTIHHKELARFHRVFDNVQSLIK